MNIQSSILNYKQDKIIEKKIYSYEKYWTIFSYISITSYNKKIQEFILIHSY